MRTVEELAGDHGVIPLYNAEEAIFNAANKMLEASKCLSDAYIYLASTSYSVDGNLAAKIICMQSSIQDMFDLAVVKPGKIGLLAEQVGDLSRHLNGV